MFNKSMFDNFKEKAQQSFEDIKKEAIKVQESIEDKIEEQISSKNNLSLKDENFVSNSSINKAAQLLIEKSTKQAEQFLDKYIKPYDVCEITDPEFAKIIINEINNKIKNNDNDKYLYELAVLYINTHDIMNAVNCINNFKNENDKNELSIAIEISNMNDIPFVINFEKNKELLINLRIYAIFRRYVDLSIKNKNYLKAKEIVEACTQLNPTSLQDQKNLLQCYEELGESKYAKLQNIIVRNLENKY